MLINFLKKEKGVTLTDIAAAIVIFSIFVGVIGRIYYMIAYNNSMITLDAIATYYVVKIAEEVDRIAYEDVESKTNTELKEMLAARYENESTPWPESLNINMSVTNYNDEDLTKDDIIKKVTIEAQYNIFKDNVQKYTINSIKVKEK